jgi:hypothetical protein
MIFIYYPQGLILILHHDESFRLIHEIRQPRIDINLNLAGKCTGIAEGQNNMDTLTRY